MKRVLLIALLSAAAGPALAQERLPPEARPSPMEQAVYVRLSEMARMRDLSRQFERDALVDMQKAARSPESVRRRRITPEEAEVLRELGEEIRKIDTDRAIDRRAKSPGYYPLYY